MAVTSPPGRLEFAKLVLASPQLTSALAITSIGTAALSFPIHQLLGWAGLIAIVTGLVLLAACSLAAQWREIGWSGLLPISLMAFVGWAIVSIFWSQYHWSSAGGIAYLFAFTVLGIYIALARDTIQVVRAFGDVLRFVLALSLALEILSGILLNRPINLLGITGRLAYLGPIQGLLATRDQLGLVALIAVITFTIELLTRSVSRSRATGSLILGLLMLGLTRAPLAFGAALIVLAAAFALWALRRASDSARPYWQLGVLVVALAAAITAWVQRGPIVTAFNATGDLNYRLSVWRQVWDLLQSKSLQGWGWVGAWPVSHTPFNLFLSISTRVPGSALNAYLDVWFQLGLIGIIVFLGFLGLTFVRSWLLASRRRSVVFAWPALILVALLVGSLAESSILVEFGWLTLVVCSVKASRELSWRRAFEATAIPQILPESPPTT